jgi:general secretion pathway protein K
MARRREGGYAVIAAVAAVAFFGYLALAAIAGGRSAVVAANAGLARARLTADADAGVALAIHDLGLSDPSRRWSLTGPPHRIEFRGASLSIAVEDENGKIPLNFVQAPQLRRLFEQAGADPRTIDGLVEALLDLRGDPGRGASDPRIEAQRGTLSAVDELALLPGMTPGLYARIAPAITVSATTLAFDPRTASPLALAVMSPANANSPAPDLQHPLSLSGRTVTVRVDVADGRGGQMRRTATVEFTGAASRPFIMRALD